MKYIFNLAIFFLYYLYISIRHNKFFYSTFICGISSCKLAHTLEKIYDFNIYVLISL